MLAIIWAVIVILAAFVPGLLTAVDPLRAAPKQKLLAPSFQHLFGTDQLGRDLFSRTVHGAGLSLGAALIAVAVGLVVGSLLGLLAGFLRGWVDEALMRVVDVLLAIPALLLSLALVTALGFGTVKVAIAVGISSIAACARVMRSEVLRVREGAYVEAAEAGGAPAQSGALPARAAQFDRTRAGAGHPGDRDGHPGGLLPELPRVWRCTADAGMGIAGRRRTRLSRYRMVDDPHAGADHRPDRARGRSNLPCPRWPGRCPMVSLTGTSTETLLVITDLAVRYRSKHRHVDAVRQVDLTIAAG